MTYTLEKLTSYVDNSIDSMDRKIEYAKTIEGWTNERRSEWAVGCVESEHDKAFGALVFAQVYLKEITEAQYKKLNDRLFDEFWKAREKAREIKYQD